MLPEGILWDFGHGGPRDSSKTVAPVAKLISCSFPLLGARKKHINSFQYKLFGPHSKPPIWAPRKKLMCLISWERTQKRDPHKLYWGDLGGQIQGPKPAIFGHKNFSLLFFPALICEDEDVGGAAPLLKNDITSHSFAASPVLLVCYSCFPLSITSLCFSLLITPSTCSSSHCFLFFFLFFSLVNVFFLFFCFLSFVILFVFLSLLCFPPPPLRFFFYNIFMFCFCFIVCLFYLVIFILF